MLRLLTFTTLFPHAAAENQGVFVENRLRQLVAGGQAQASVLAPVPWFPSSHPGFGAWARHAAAPAREVRHGMEVLHPRFLAVPKLGMQLGPDLLYAAAARSLARLLAAGRRFDLIDAHYLYPDGVAAIRLGRRFGLPVVLTARGSDVTQLPDFARPRRLILDAVARADAVVTVSDGLRRALGALGADTARITVLRNGVDLAMFRPLPVASCRARWGVAGKVLVSVGGLIPRKGHALTIAALAELPDWQLLIAGEGPERASLLRLAERLGVASRVRLLGAVAHGELASLYGAADISVLASSREGWANVLLESMACGTPVVASPIAGNDEVVASPAAGVIAAARTPAALAAGVRALAAGLPERAATMSYASGFSWAATTQGQLDLFAAVLARRGGAG